MAIRRYYHYHHPVQVSADFSPNKGTEWGNNPLQRSGVCVFEAYDTHMVIPAATKKKTKVPQNAVQITLNEPSFAYVSMVKPLQNNKFTGAFKQCSVNERTIICDKWKRYFSCNTPDSDMHGPNPGGRGTVWQIKATEVPAQLVHLLDIQGPRTLDVVILSKNRSFTEEKGGLIVPIKDGIGYFDCAMFISEERLAGSTLLGTIDPEDVRSVLEIIYREMGGQEQFL